MQAFLSGNTTVAVRRPHGIADGRALRRACGNYDVQFPDGWAVQPTGASARFTHGWSGMQVVWTQMADTFEWRQAG